MEQWKASKYKKVKKGQKKRATVCFTKERKAQKAIREMKWYEGWSVKVSRKKHNKNRSGKFSSLSEGKQEQYRNREMKTKGNLKKELEKMRNGIKEIKNTIVKKNKDWLETNQKKQPNKQSTKKKKKGRKSK